MEGYLVEVKGDYFGTASEYDRKREKYPYRITVKVPRPEGALSLIKNKLLDKVLRRNYSNYHSWRTHQLVSITNLDGSKVHGLTDPRLMDFNDLAAYVHKNNLPLKLELYTDLGYMRTMVYLAETNQHEFLIKQENLQREHAEDVALAKLNPEIYGSQGSKPLEGIKEKHEKKVDNAIVKAFVDSAKKTNILQGKASVPKPSDEGDMFTEYVADGSPSTLATEGKPKTQKVEKVYVKGEGFVNADNFEEDFTREYEKEYEVYEPHKVEQIGSEGSRTRVEEKTETAEKETPTCVVPATVEDL